MTKPQKAGKAAVKAVSGIVDFIFIALLIFLLIFAGYTRWDSQQLYTAADPERYIMYKPSPPDVVSFEELQEINPDVLGWLTVYGTNIDYPLVQDPEGNTKYLDHNAKGEVEGSGALFLDHKNSPDFSDFNTIIYGHHMAKHKMFGDIDEFLNEDFFNTHEFGNLIYGNQNHGLQFVAMLQVDGYDSSLYKPGVAGEQERLSYIDHIYERAMYLRGVTKTGAQTSPTGTRREPVTPDDRIILMSTCSADTTNGRYVLVAKLLDHPVENPYPDTEKKIEKRKIDTSEISYRIGKHSVWMWIIILILLILLTLTAYLLVRRHDRKKRQ